MLSTKQVKLVAITGAWLSTLMLSFIIAPGAPELSLLQAINTDLAFTQIAKPNLSVVLIAGEAVMLCSALTKSCWLPPSLPFVLPEIFPFRHSNPALHAAFAGTVPLHWP